MRSPTDRSKSNHRSPKEQPLQVRPLTANPAQSSPAKDSLTTFATGVCQSETARSFEAPDASKPQKPTRNAKADFYDRLNARRQPAMVSGKSSPTQPQMRTSP
jgi:hypothetical protein